MAAQGKKAWTSARTNSNAGADAQRKARKVARRQAQDRAALDNQSHRAHGRMTSWEISKAKRAGTQPERIALREARQAAQRKVDAIKLRKREIAKARATA